MEMRAGGPAERVTTFTDVRTMVRLPMTLGLALLTGLGSGCRTSDSNAVGLWEGQMDSLPSGTLVVDNRGHGLWAPDEAWQLT